MPSFGAAFLFYILFTILPINFSKSGINEVKPIINREIQEYKNHFLSY